MEQDRQTGERPWWQHYNDPPVQLDPLLAAALDLCVKFGYHGTSVRAIANNADMTVPGLYYRYKSKQDILAELLMLSNEDLTRRSTAALEAAGPSPRDRFAALIRCVVLHMTHMRKFAHLARDIDALDKSHRTKHVELRDQFERLVLTEVVAGQTLGQFAPSDAHETTRAVLTMCRGVSEWFRIEGTATPDQIADRYVGFALALALDLDYLAERTNTTTAQQTLGLNQTPP